MGRLLKLEFRKNIKSIFLYIGFLGIFAYLITGLLGEMYTNMSGKEALFVIGSCVFTAHLILQSAYTYLVVRDFEAGTIKEYMFVGYSRTEIFSVKYLTLLIESSIALILSSGGIFLWKTLQNGYGAQWNGKEAIFIIKLVVGSIVASAFLSMLSMLCVVIVNNALAVGLAFLLPGILDTVASIAIVKLEAPLWLSVRYLVNCFYSSELKVKDYGIALAAMLIAGVVVGALGMLLFKKKEYR